MGGHIEVEEAARSSRRNIKNVGRGYHKQSLEAIQSCRMLARHSPQGESTQNDALLHLYDLLDCAIDAAVKAGKFESEKATTAFQTFEVEALKYVDKYHTTKEQTIIIPDFHGEMEKAKHEDAASLKLCNRIVQRLGSNPASAFSADNIIQFQFVVLKAPHVRVPDNIICPIKLDPVAKNSEVLWNLRCRGACSLKQNPHFYNHSNLPAEPSSYGPKFIRDPATDFRASKGSGTPTFYVLTDRNSRIFVKYEIDKRSRTFGNIYRPDSTVILKDQNGILEAADTVIKSASPSTPSPTQSSSRRPQARETGIAAWRESLNRALDADTQDWILHPSEPPVNYRHTRVLSLPPPPTSPPRPLPKPAKTPTPIANRPSSRPLPATPPLRPDTPAEPDAHTPLRRPSLAPLQGLQSSTAAPYQSGSTFGSYTAVDPSVTSAGTFYTSSGTLGAFSSASSSFPQPNSAPPVEKKSWIRRHIIEPVKSFARGAKH
ncbi:hypothetical protein BV25DRAFT_1738357 [Artomyces pyxidatus]|uniref:Uncharacterized protein n=1 Tax=Artomyces pyxidatus TaxID=48021 RepID=A0ACB8SGY4_9AGAM|nr:hypothetical protein BV25DRAFT_1738357 [Artomyces pyxidatus]